jgi:hypothetical protein
MGSASRYAGLTSEPNWRLLKGCQNDNQVFRTEMKSWYSANVSSKNAKGCSSNGWLVKHTVQFALDRGVGTVDKN